MTISINSKKFAKSKKITENKNEKYSNCWKCNKNITRNAKKEWKLL